MLYSDTWKYLRTYKWGIYVYDLTIVHAYNLEETKVTMAFQNPEVMLY